MRKTYLTLLLFLGFFINVMGQNVEKSINVEGKAAELKKLSASIKAQTLNNREKALKLAPTKGWIVNMVLPNGEIATLQGIDEGGMPIYYATDFNVRAAATIGTNKLWPEGSTGLNLNGSSSFMDGKIAVWDGGRVLSTHQELTGRITLEDNSASLSDHSTHVAGTMIASGVNSLAKGMSNGATVLKTWDYTDDQSEMSSAASNLLISNHSYGTIAGWRYNTSRAGTSTNPFWEWWGDPNISTYEDYNFGYYNSATQTWDQIAYYSPYYLIVKSSGNNRSYTGPEIGSPYWTHDAFGSWELVSARTAGSISNNDTYDNISTYGNAKNILTVGAVNPIPNGFKKVDNIVLSDFSSCGPTDDGRIKPDVVANGVDVYSCISTGDKYYETMSGTSMATPNASGSIFLLQELYHKLNDKFMLSSTLKGLVCHTADDAGNVGPDYQYGWGLINMEHAASVISNTENTNLIEEISLSSGTTETRNVIASGKGKLIATICWTDPAATPISYGTSMLNNRSPRLINDLDVRISDGTNTYMPWKLDVNSPSTAATKGDNTVDNIEQIVIDNPVPGKTYTISISHKNSLSSAPQVFSLIVSGIGGTATETSSATDSNDSRIDNVLFNTIDNNATSGCQSYQDFTNLTTSLNLGSTYPITITTGTCGAENNRAIKVFIDWNSNGTFESNELAATSSILNTSGDFTSNIQIPTTVNVGTFARMRIVLMETSDVNEIAATGNYSKGETQDYLVKFEAASVDLGINSFSMPNDQSYTSEDQIIELNLENFGTLHISDITFSAKVEEDGNVIANFSEVYDGSIKSLSNDVFRFKDSFATKPGFTYKITCTATVTGDSNESNNTIEKEFSIPALKEVTDASAIHCDGSSSVNLSANGDGTLFWYDAETNGNLIVTGNSASTNTIPSGNSYYVGLNNYSNSIGPDTKDSSPWSNGTYTQATAHPLITTYVPLIIKSARLYVGWPGKITFWIEEATTGAIVSTTTINVSATRNPASSVVGESNDLTDTGAEYQLNLAIPTPGDYRIRISYEDGATLYRNNAQTSNPYPYTISNIMSINTTSASGTPNAYYYWLYDMKVEGYGAPSALTEVTIQDKPTPTVDLGSDNTATESITLDAGNLGCSYLWSTNETTQTITVSHGGTYSVTVTNEWGCKASDSVVITFTDVNPEEVLPITVYPNPASNLFFVESDQEVLVDVYSLSGVKVIQKTTPSVKHSVDISNLSPSIYLVKVFYVNSDKYKLYKIVVK
ncbi:MAG: S8 family serine peptidase [Bacteroidales bacterium]